jgi:hypothetical protein
VFLGLFEGILQLLHGMLAHFIPSGRINVLDSNQLSLKRQAFSFEVKNIQGVDCKGKKKKSFDMMCNRYHLN